jgi:hypothetical protein
MKVDPGGSRSWVLRMARHGHMTVLGLGPLRHVSLAQARVAAAEARRSLRDGIDPRGKRTGMTFGDAAEAYITAHRDKWKHERQERHWRASLANHTGSLLTMPVGEVDTTGHPAVRRRSRQSPEQRTRCPWQHHATVSATIFPRIEPARELVG